MAYDLQWKRLSAAVTWVVAETGVSREQAQIDICHAVADRVINLRGQLKKQARGPMKSKEIIYAADLELLPTIQPEELDWEQSRPIEPWQVKRPHRYPGFWELAWIELSTPDIIKVFGATKKPGEASGSTLSHRTATKGQPTSDRAKQAINAKWPGGPPDQTALPNKQFVGLVQQKLKDLGLPAVSPDTILRAAGRRK